MASGDYLRAGLALPFHPHRDTWFSAPFTQINWWLPVYEINTENCMTSHLRYWETQIANSSNEYDHDEWQRTGRVAAANSGRRP